jgi:hypothetical protein
MKAIAALLMVSLLLPVGAVAGDWQAYIYTDPGFAVQFPAAPSVETSKIRNAAGVTLPMTRYEVRQDHILYTLSVVNYASTNADPLSTIAETARSLSASGKVTANAGTRVNGVFGRRMSIDGADGTRSAVAIFFANKHLYTLAGRALPPPSAEETRDANRFRESLQFLADEDGFGSFFHGIAAGGSVARAPKNVELPPADSPCAGKSAGDAVQLETPGGPVAATCVLVARPNAK